MRPHSGPFLSFLAYYMGAPSEQFLRINYGGPLRSVYSLNMEASILMYFFILYGGLSDHFFAYYIGAPRSHSSLTIWGPSGQFLLIQYGGPSQITFIDYYMPPPPPPQISFFACYRGATSDYIFFTKYMGPPRSVSPLTIWGPLRLVSLLTIWGPLRSVSVHTFWGPSQISFFSYYMGPPQISFFRILYGGPLRSVSSPPICGSPEISFFAYYIRGPHQISFFAY